MVADAVNNELFITISVTVPSNVASQARPGHSLTATPDVRGASKSPEGGTEAEVAAKYAAGARRPPA